MVELLATWRAPVGWVRLCEVRDEQRKNAEGRTRVDEVCGSFGVADTKKVGSRTDTVVRFYYLALVTGFYACACLVIPSLVVGTYTL